MAPNPYLAHLAGGDEICLTKDVYDSSGIADILAPYVVEESQAEFKGVTNAVSVYRVSAGAA